MTSIAYPPPRGSLQRAQRARLGGLFAFMGLHVDSVLSNKRARVDCAAFASVASWAHEQLHPRRHALGTCGAARPRAPQTPHIQECPARSGKLFGARGKICFAVACRADAALGE